MPWDAQEFSRNLKDAISKHERAEVERLCNQLIGYLTGTGAAYPQKEQEQVVQTLQNDRLFSLVLGVAATLIQNGQASHKVRRQYAQALIEEGKPNDAIQELKALAADTGDDSRENAEAWGLLGRAYKQLYVNANDPTAAGSRQNLEQSLRAYLELYEQKPSEAGWHGINTVAMLCRANNDGVILSGYPDPRKLAQDILDDIETKAAEGRATIWDRATAAEACVALGRREDAIQWLLRYAQDTSVNVFQLASTLRQFFEVWRLRRDQEPGKSLIPILEAELLKRESGSVDLSANDIRQAFAAIGDRGGWEKVFGSDAYQSLDWLLTAVERARAVARIGLEPSRGEGTGFLIRGGDFYEPFGDELLLFTNAHVISKDPQDEPAVRHEDAVITFNGPDMPGANEVFNAKDIVWSSPRTKLDATLLRLDRAVDGVVPYPIAANPPVVDGKRCVNIIGHPRGGVLSFSFRDSKLLDIEIPKLHYRTPTEGGSSGSPVFAGPQWKLIGIHHWGSAQAEKLHGQPGTYEVNEGIWIGSIIEQIRQDRPGKA
jgi:hypothetical protein